MRFFNSSLSSGIVPRFLKHAVAVPFKKKKSLDPAILSNIRPGSKMPFLSKKFWRKEFPFKLNPM